jgi:hypothetical protein
MEFAVKALGSCLVTSGFRGGRGTNSGIMPWRAMRGGFPQSVRHGTMRAKRPRLQLPKLFAFSTTFETDISLQQPHVHSRRLLIAA